MTPTHAATNLKAAEVSSTDLAVDLARFAARIRAGALDRAVIEAVKANILDTLACAIAGSSSNWRIRAGPGQAGASDDNRDHDEWDALLAQHLMHERHGD